MNQYVFWMRGGVFAGSITYHSLLGRDMADAVQKDYVILDEHIWENGRRYFRNFLDSSETVLLPVLNAERQLVCFAYQDGEADRELRMLDELRECGDALGFQDVYPEYDSVTVCGFHELAYAFVQYLEESGVPVSVKGAMWDVFGTHEALETLDYRTFTVYAEGTGRLEKEIALRDSVSPEFECIDRIYEENICNGSITDAEGDFNDLLERLRGRQIALIGTGENSLNAYDLLLKYGIDITCFVTGNKQDFGRKLLGKKIIGLGEASRNIESITFIETSSKYSAWGFGGTNRYHYFGFKRNNSFFLLQDYIKIPLRGLLSAINNASIQLQSKVVMFGDFYLCLKVKQILGEKIKAQYKIVYCDILNEYKGQKIEQNLKEIKKEEIKETDICLLLRPEYYDCYYKRGNFKEIYRDRRQNEYLDIIKKYYKSIVLNYQVEVENELLKDGKQEINNKKSVFKVGKIVLGSIENLSGNVFFRGILDNHPQVIVMEYSYLNNNLYNICIRLAMVKSKYILSLLWKLMNECGEYCEYKMLWDTEQKIKFNYSMKKMLEEKDVFTSQELFVMIHLAYAEIWGMKIHKLSSTIIYWEPHGVPRNRLEHYAVWLGSVCDTGYIVNLVRNAYIRSGAMLKSLERDKILRFAGSHAFYLSLVNPGEDKEEYTGWKRITIKFEDIKCRPKEKLLYLCSELKMEWSDTLLDTTIHGEKECYEGRTAGYDLKPVYRTYEEFYSEFDRFRIALSAGHWQKKYGYPYVSILNFNRRELQEMFSKDFRFEKALVFHNDEERKKFKKGLKSFISSRLWEVRRKAIVEKYKRGPYMKEGTGERNEKDGGKA